MFIVVISRDTTLTAASSRAVLLPVEGFLNKYVEKKRKKTLRVLVAFSPENLMHTVPVKPTLWGTVSGANLKYPLPKNRVPMPTIGGGLLKATLVRRTT